MKKSLSILFIFIFLYNYCGYYITFIIQQHYAKKEIKRQLVKSIPENELCKIIIPFYSKNKLTWYENNKEFKYEGNMYDIVKQVKTRISTIYYCIQDNKENKLYQKLNQHVLNNLENDINQKEKSQKIMKKIFFDYYFIHKTLYSYNKYNINYRYNFNSAMPESDVKDVITPPPELPVFFA